MDEKIEKDTLNTNDITQSLVDEFLDDNAIEALD
jgi:hypothetical protein